MSVDKHPDILDQAQALTEHTTQKMIEKIRANAKPEYDPHFDGVHCVEESCGVEIPEARRKAGRVRCVDCQSLLEQSQAFFRR